MHLQASEGRCPICEIRRANYLRLLKREEQLAAALHDLRHHALVIRWLVRNNSEEQLDKYINSFVGGLPEHDPIFYCEHYLINSLLELYTNLAKQQETEFAVRANLPNAVSVKDTDLSVILSNLLENALEAARKIPAERRMVSVRVALAYDTLGIKVENAFDGDVQVKNGWFYSSKQTGRKGVGLASVRSVCQNYGGNANFYADEGNIFHSEIMLPVSDS